MGSHIQSGSLNILDLSPESLVLLKTVNRAAFHQAPLYGSMLQHHLPRGHRSSTCWIPYKVLFGLKFSGWKYNRQTEILVLLSENMYRKEKKLKTIWYKNIKIAYMLQFLIWQRNKPALNAGPHSSQRALCQAPWSTTEENGGYVNDY